jgi:hypothetical protein
VDCEMLTVSLNFDPNPYDKGHMRSSKKATRNKLTCTVLENNFMDAFRQNPSLTLFLST